MILIDYSGVVLGPILSQDEDTDIDLLRHYVLNTLRALNVKFREQYGEMVLCMDFGSWRRDYFKYYKAKRREAKSGEDKEKWKKVFENLNQLADELKQNFPYKWIRVYNAEADDIIGVLASYVKEPTIIISGDKDFLQLQKYPHIKQYSPRFKKFLQEDDPENFLFEHILKGDSGDGIPNILSPDDVFVSGKRQTPLTKKRIQQLKEEGIPPSLEANFMRNKVLIDLSEVPTDLEEQIINEFNKPAASGNNIMNYLIKHRLRLLLECMGDFKSGKQFSTKPTLF